jgi:hypothetical protein
LRNQLPAGYVAGPRVHSGSQVRVDSLPPLAAG